MKRLGTLTLALILTFTSNFALAQETTESAFIPHWYGTLHIGQTTTSLNEFDQEFSFLSMGGSLGYRFSEIFATEFYMSFATNDENDRVASAILGESVGASFDAMGMYLTAQSKGDLYVKGRAGLIQSGFTYSAKGYEDEKGTDFGLSYGIGAGAKKDNLFFEIDYIVFPEVGDPLFNDASYDSSIVSLAIGSNF